MKYSFMSNNAWYMKKAELYTELNWQESAGLVYVMMNTRSGIGYWDAYFQRFVKISTAISLGNPPWLLGYIVETKYFEIKDSRFGELFHHYAFTDADWAPDVTTRICSLMLRDNE